jgi:hypothetical protein
MFPSLPAAVTLNEPFHFASAIPADDALGKWDDYMLSDIAHLTVHTEVNTTMEDANFANDDLSDFLLGDFPQWNQESDVNVEARSLSSTSSLRELPLKPASQAARFHSAPVKEDWCPCHL